jgi:hypothetical protein
VPEVDFIVVGEGERAFADLLGRLLSNQPFVMPIQGLAWRNGLGVPVVGGLAEVLQHIDDLPSPFQQPEFSGRGLRKVLYESYRGCAFRCSFCLYQRDYAAQRYFSDDRVKADLDAILDAGATHIRFVDATFNLNRRRAKDLLRHLQGCRADVCVEVSAEFFDAEMVGLLPNAGVRHIDIGLQSTQPTALKAVQREWYREDRFRENIELLRAEPALTLNVELIAGLPGDSLDGVRRSIDEAVRRWPDHVSVYRLLGLRGTPLERDSERLGLRFSPRPPYELLESTGFPGDALPRVDELTFAHLVLFNLGVGRYALRYLVEVFDRLPCDVYDEFLEVTLQTGLFDMDEVRFLGRHHAYGNRFDQTMPAGLDLARVHRATRLFFERALKCIDEAERDLALDLVDFGHSLASLDSVKRTELALSTEHPRLAPWCQRRAYRPSVIAELSRQGHGLGTLAPEEVADIVFFVHPEFGPAALAVDRAAAEFLDGIADGTAEAQDTGAEVFRNLAILT